jgi:hypothetical protein
MSDDNPAGGGSPGDASIAAGYLDWCGVICRIETARNGTVTSLNEAARRFLGARPGRYAGQALSDFLTAPDAARFADLLARAPAEEEIMLNLGAATAVPRTLRCLAYALPDRCLILGHESRDTAERLERTLIELNNGLAVALREQQKDRVAAKQAAADVSDAVETLHSNYWLIDRVGSLLPICMDCGRVNASDETWQDVVSFLKSRSSFLSHGYCPDCYARIISDQGPA